MPQETVQVAPSLSTHQDESTFYEKYEHVASDRKHLSLEPFSAAEIPKLIESYYSIDDTVEFITARPQCKRVTLQFPDSLVCDSSAVAQAISERLDRVSNEAVERQTVWILADTSYSPCCVDEVAAQHVKGDLVIHYGDACLNPVNKIDVGYVFGKPAINTTNLINQFKLRYELDAKVVLMADAPYSHNLYNIYLTLKQDFPNLAYADVLQSSFPSSTIIGYNPKTSTDQLELLNRSFHGLEEGEIEEVLASYDVFHINTPESPRLLKLTTVFQSVTLYNPREESCSQGPFPNLMRRYRYMHVARSAGTVGLLVNTLSLANTKIVLNKLKEKIIEAGKKHYMFVVGKPNVAKLANFELVDIWVILGCDHQGIIIDQNNEYFKPIITPFELLLALNQELLWTGKWETDFNKLLTQMGEQVEVQDSDDDEPQFNPVTGTYVSTSRPLRKPQYLQVDSKPADSSDALVQRFSSDVVIKDTVSTAAVQLQNRHWTGLGSDYVDDEESQEGALVEDGIRGIARGYEFDVNNK